MATKANRDVEFSRRHDIEGQFARDVVRQKEDEERAQRKKSRGEEQEMARIGTPRAMMTPGRRSRRVGMP